MAARRDANGQRACPAALGWLLLPAALAGLHWACGSDSDDGGLGGGGDFGGSGGSGGSSSGGSGFAAGGSSAGGSSGGPPPEQELEASFQSPVATGRYVWTANPQSGRVALVDAFDFQVTVVEAGYQPTYLASVSRAQEGADSAIVLNVGSNDATLFRVAEGEIATKNLRTHPGANSWSLSKQGRWAVAWTNAAEIESPDPTDSFQDVTVLDLSEGGELTTRLSVGYRPTRIFFDDAETRVFAVCEPGISVIELDDPGARIGPLIEVSDDPLEDPATRDVSVTADGRWALVRREGSPEVRLVGLDGSEDVISVELPDAVTDLDVAADGSFAVAVMRATATVAVLPLPGIAEDPAAFQTALVDGERFGSVSLSADGSKAFLYTNAVDDDHLTILDLPTRAHRVVALKAPVRAVFAADDGAHAIVLMNPAPGSSKPGAFAVVPTAGNLAPKISGTDAPPQAVALSPDGTRAVITVRDDASRTWGMYLARMPSLQVDYSQLASPPLATGVVPGARRAYVSQLHPEGRITFVDLEGGNVRTLTGFELGARVVD